MIAGKDRKGRHGAPELRARYRGGFATSVQGEGVMAIFTGDFEASALHVHAVSTDGPRKSHAACQCRDPREVPSSRPA
jgi:hypothetical protein